MHRPDRPTLNPPGAAPAPRRTYRSSSLLDASVLALLGQCEKPATAYELAERSRESSTPLSPMQAYRVLGRLVDRGSVRRIELLSAYVLAPDAPTGFRVCRNCGQCEPFLINNFAQIVHQLQIVMSFVVTRSVFEVTGTCHQCLVHNLGANGRHDRITRRRPILPLMIGACLASAETPVEAEGSHRPMLLAGSPVREAVGHETRPDRYDLLGA
jgi:Fe2+ or Zn2+ uptake regulation protein